MAKLLLLDGNSLTHRAFNALPTDLATAAGQVTNAVLGFSLMLTYMVNDLKPDGVIVAFDRKEPTFRHSMIDNYKAGREATPDILLQQFGLVRRMIETLGLPIVDKAGFEADDIIGTLANRLADGGHDAIIVTGDRDTYQLVRDPHIKVLYNKRGVTDYVLYDEAGIVERTGVHPSLYSQYAALRGDPSDNLPGVPGVGEKTAAKLLNKYGSLDVLFEHKDEQTPKLRQNLTEFEEQVRQVAAVTPLDVEVELDLDPTTVRFGDWDVPAARGLFASLEIRSFDRLADALGIPDLPAAQGDEGLLVEAFEVEFERFDTAEGAVGYLHMLASGGPIAAFARWEGKAGRSPLVELAFAPVDDATGRVGVLDASVMNSVEVLAGLGVLLGPGGPSVHGHDLKPLLRTLASYNLALPAIGLDTAVVAYLLDPAKDTYLLEEVAARYAGIEVASPDAPPPGELDLGDGPGAPEGTEAARKAAATARLVAPLSAALEARGLVRLWEDVERPLVSVLARMEDLGIRVDVDYIQSLADELTAEAKEREGNIQRLAGREFTVNSTPQLREVLFGTVESGGLGLQPSKRTKTGFSTDAQSLEKLKGQHPIVEELLRYREVEKLRSTYGTSLLAEVAADGRIHATFHQTVARTGRLSSEEPNLHNIPVRSEDGRRFRRAFLPREGWDLLVADYNQIELRVIAHLSADPGLMDAFTTGKDIHTATAAKVFEVDPAEVTVEQRSKAKMVSYGLAYGMESFGLAQRLAIPQSEAKVILDAYFEGFPAVRDYMDNVVAEARSKGYTETMFGRRRMIPELQARNYNLRLAGERQAKNAPIQGLAADIFKVALVHLDAALAAAGHEAHIMLQVHDEVLLEVPPSEHAAVGELTVRTMHEAADLRVPLEVNLSWGATWAAAKG